MKDAKESFEVFHRIARAFLGMLYREDLTKEQLHYLARKSIASQAAKKALDADYYALPDFSQDESLYHGDISHYDKFFDDSLDVFASFIKVLVASDKNLDKAVRLSNRPDLVRFIVQEMVYQASTQCLK